MLLFSSGGYTSSLATAVTLDIPTAVEYKAKLEDEFKQFNDYYVTLFAVMALVFVVKGIVS